VSKEAEVLIRTEDLWKTYEMGSTEVHALQGVTFDDSRNEYVAIMGPSGSGKIHVDEFSFGCLDTPTPREVLVERKTRQRNGRRRTRTYSQQRDGFVFQTVQSSFPALPPPPQTWSFP
jgi:putative ABC transport system ATP-binding protein